MPYSDKEKNKEYQRQWKRDHKNWYRDYKATLSCSKCGFSHPAVIQFHHPREKEFNISRAVNSKTSRERIMAEIAKCEILCANCHFILHYNEGYDYSKPSVAESPSLV